MYFLCFHFYAVYWRKIKLFKGFDYMHLFEYFSFYLVYLHLGTWRNFSLFFSRDVYFFILSNRGMDLILTVSLVSVEQEELWVCLFWL